VLYLSAAESPQYAANEAEHARVGGALLGALLGRRRAVRQRERELAAVYRRLFEAWRLYITGVASAAPGPAAGEAGRAVCVCCGELSRALWVVLPLLCDGSPFRTHSSASETRTRERRALHPSAAHCTLPIALP